MSVVAILGSSGFIGRACVRSAEGQFSDVIRVRAPRLSADPAVPLATLMHSPEVGVAMEALRLALVGADVVINAAGVAAATERHSLGVLFGANYLLPNVVARSAEAVGISRFVQVSSAAVLGSGVLDESDRFAPFSPYSMSKTMAEVTLREHRGDLGITRFRPTSVHGVGRPLSKILARFARSSWSSVAGDGSRHTPQVLVENVASAVMLCATGTGDVPAVVLQPSEGLTCREVMLALGCGRRPRRMPSWAAHQVVTVGERIGSLAGQARRLEMLWFGQEQHNGWLASADWSPISHVEAWWELGRQLEQLDRQGREP